MSYTSLIFFKDKKPFKEIAFKNAWGGAARIWDSLFDRYLKNPNIPYHCWLQDKGRDLWDLAIRLDIPLFERAVHAFTFDKFYVKQSNFKQFSKDLRLFLVKYPTKMKVCHLAKWADLIENSEEEAIGLYSTSVGENLWYEWDEEKEQKIPVSLDKGREVYDWLNNV